MVGFIIFIAVLAVIAIIVLIFGSWLLESFLGGLICFLIAGVFMGLVIALPVGVTTVAEDHWATCTVTGKDRGGDDGSYRVYTSDCGVLANGDNPLWNKYNSADIWQLIPDKGTITVHLVGVRNGFFSMFPNIIEIKEAEGAK